MEEHLKDLLFAFVGIVLVGVIAAFHFAPSASESKCLAQYPNVIAQTRTAYGYVEHSICYSDATH